MFVGLALRPGPGRPSPDDAIACDSSLCIAVRADAYACCPALSCRRPPGQEVERLPSCSHALLRRGAATASLRAAAFLPRLGDELLLPFFLFPIRTART
jgi:hypothetical protein